jgi:hypothetical protein
MLTVDFEPCQCLGVPKTCEGANHRNQILQIGFSIVDSMSKVPGSISIVHEEKCTGDFIEGKLLTTCRAISKAQAGSGDMFIIRTNKAAS